MGNIVRILLCFILLFLFVGCSIPEKSIETPSPTSTTAVIAPIIPQGDLVVAAQSFGGENWLPWEDVTFSFIYGIIYDVLIYWDYENQKPIPGLAESWEVSQDGMTLIYHLRKGVQFTDGWGELTSEDIKYNFERHANSTSVGKTAQCRRITNMDASDPYTLIVNFKDSYPNFYMDLSLGASNACQGIVSKKYLETVGDEVAAKKPIGSGPYKLIDFEFSEYYKFEAQSTHWRVVPEFKFLTYRLIPEMATVVASLKTGEISIASSVASYLVKDLEDAGITSEVNYYGGFYLIANFGGLIIPDDKRYNAEQANKDPWTNKLVRQAMNIAIDRNAINNALFQGMYTPVSVPLSDIGSDKFQYAYNITLAKQLLAEAGYPSGFEFNIISYIPQGAPETPKIVEILASSWEEIGLKPKIVMVDYNYYMTNNINKCKTAGDIFVKSIGLGADMLSRFELSLIPNVASPINIDSEAYAIYKKLPKNASFEVRQSLIKELNQYYFDNYTMVPIMKISPHFSWNPDVVAPWPHSYGGTTYYMEYVKHAKPLNTFRLFSPYPSR